MNVGIHLSVLLYGRSWKISLNVHIVYNTRYCVITSMMLQSLSLALIIDFTFINKFSELCRSYFRHV
jgi:hypothetical protein